MMSRYFYLVFILICIHNSFCNVEDHDRDRHRARSARQTAYKPRRHIQRNSKAHHQGVRKIRGDNDAGEHNDLLQEFDLASFMQSPDYGNIDRHQQFSHDNNNRFRESEYAVNRMNDDMMIDKQNRFVKEIQGIAQNTLDKYQQLPYNVDNNNQYGKQYEVEATKSTKTTLPQSKWGYRGITFPFFSHNKVLKANHKKTKRKYDIYDDRERRNDDHVQLQSSRYFSKPRSYKIMKRSNTPQCNCGFCRTMRLMRKRRACNYIKVKNDEPHSFSRHGRHVRQLNMPDEWKDFEIDMTSEGEFETPKTELPKPEHEVQQQLKELSEVEQKVDSVSIKPIYIKYT